jgi:hypothetical protein
VTTTHRQQRIGKSLRDWFSRLRWRATEPGGSWENCHSPRSLRPLSWLGPNCPSNCVHRKCRTRNRATSEYHPGYRYACRLRRNGYSCKGPVGAEHGYPPAYYREDRQKGTPKQVIDPGTGRPNEHRSSCEPEQQAREGNYISGRAHRPRLCRYESAGYADGERTQHHAQRGDDPMAGRWRIQGGQLLFHEYQPPVQPTLVLSVVALPGLLAIVRQASQVRVLL